MASEAYKVAKALWSVTGAPEDHCDRIATIFDICVRAKMQEQQEALDTQKAKEQ